MTGVAATIDGHLPILHTGWILWTLILFSISGLAFMVRIAPLQRQLYSVAKIGQDGGEFEYAHYRALAIRWELWRGIALLAPMAGLALMVLKPSL